MNKNNIRNFTKYFSLIVLFVIFLFDFVFADCENPECTPPSCENEDYLPCGWKERCCQADCTWGKWNDVCDRDVDESECCGECGRLKKECGYGGSPCKWISEECIDPHPLGPGVCCFPGCCQSSSSCSQIYERKRKSQ